MELTDRELPTVLGRIRVRVGGDSPAMPFWPSLRGFSFDAVTSVVPRRPDQRARFEVLPRTAHLAALESPAEVNALIDEFLAVHR